MNQVSPFFAFKYMFLDNKFWSKFAVFFILVLCCLFPQFIPESANKIGIINYLAIFSFLMTIALFGQILYYGYFCSCIKSLAEQSGNYVLPNFNFKKDGIFGLKCFAGMMLMGIAIFIVFLILGIIFGILGTALLALIYNLNQIAGTVIGILVAAALIIAVCTLCFLYYPAAIRLFSVTQDILAFFNFKEIVKQIKENGDVYYKYIGIMVLASIFVFVTTFVVAIPIILLTNLPIFVNMILFCVILSLFAAYTNFVCVYAIAKCIK